MHAGQCRARQVEAEQGPKQKGKAGGHKGNQGAKGGTKTNIKGDAKTKEKGKGKQNADKPGAKREHCAICGPEKGENHTTEECYFNARAHPKGEGKGNI